MNLKKTFWLGLSLLMTLISSPLLANGTPEAKKAIQVLMVGGGSSHDFDKWYKGADVATLEKGGLAQVIYTDDPNSILQHIGQVDVLFLATNQAIQDPETRKAIFAFADAGKGIVLAHPSLWYNWNDWPEYNKELVSGGSRGHDAYGNFNVQVVKKHAVTKGIPTNFSLDDELYYQKIDESGPGIEVLTQASTPGKEPFPSVFVVKHPKTKIVGIALGHDAASHELEAYQTLIRNAVKWVAK